MSAEILREAASLMRERTHGVSASDGTRWGDRHGYSPLSYMRSIDAHHIAPWRPDVALAVAGYLEFAAAFASQPQPYSPTVDHALRIARAYLGGDA